MIHFLFNLKKNWQFILCIARINEQYCCSKDKKARILGPSCKISPIALQDKVMSRNQWHIEVQERHLMFKGLVQLNHNVLVLTHFYAISVCIMTQTIPLSSNGKKLLKPVVSIRLKIEMKKSRLHRSWLHGSLLTSFRPCHLSTELQNV